MKLQKWEFKFFELYVFVYLSKFHIISIELRSVYAVVHKLSD